jgi:hypothetical protein
MWMCYFFNGTTKGIAVYAFDNTAWIEKVIPLLGVQKSQLGIIVI